MKIEIKLKTRKIWEKYMYICAVGNKVTKLTAWKIFNKKWIKEKMPEIWTFFSRTHSTRSLTFCISFIHSLNFAFVSLPFFVVIIFIYDFFFIFLFSFRCTFTLYLLLSSLELSKNVSFKCLHNVKHEAVSFKIASLTDKQIHKIQLFGWFLLFLFFNFFFCFKINGKTIWT